MLINKVVIFSCEAYIIEALKDKDVYQRDNLITILGKIRGYKVFHKFTKEENKMLAEIGKTDAVEKIKKIDVDFSIYAISLLREWIMNIDKKDRPDLNISDKRILKLRGKMGADRLALNTQDDEESSRIKEIINQSEEIAKQFFHHLNNVLKGK